VLRRRLGGRRGGGIDEAVAWREGWGIEGIDEVDRLFSQEIMVSEIETGRCCRFWLARYTFGEEVIVGKVEIGKCCCERKGCNTYQSLQQQENNKTKANQTHDPLDT
jgi:hypothetical protein